MSKENIALLIVFVLLIACGFIGFELWSERKSDPPPNEKHDEQQKIIDSLEQVLKDERKARELAERKFEQSDSLAHVFWDSLNQQFNDDEKDKRIRVISDAPDSTRQSFFAKWVSEGSDH